MLKAQIDESFNIVNHADITDAIAVYAKQPKPPITVSSVEGELVTDEFLAEKSAAGTAILKPKPLVSCLDDIEVFLIPAYYQTDD